MNQIELGNKIRQIRKDKKLTLKQIAGENYTKGYISQIELGHVKPSFSVLEYIANKLNIEVEDLFTSKDKNLNMDKISIIENEYASKNYSNVLELTKHLKLDINTSLGFKIALFEAKSYFELKKYTECIEVIKGLLLNRDASIKSLDLLKTYALYGNTLFNLGLYQESIIQFNKAINYSLSYKFIDDHMIANIYLNKATAYQNLKEYELAIDHYHEVITYIKDKNVLEPLLDAFIRIGFCYYKKGDLESAKQYLHDGFQINTILDNDIQKAESQLILGYIFLEEEKYKDAESCIKIALKYFNKLNIKNGIIESMFVLAKVYKQNHLNKDVIKVLDELFSVLELVDVNHLDKDLLKGIANLYMEYGHHKRASFLYSLLVNNS